MNLFLSPSFSSSSSQQVPRLPLPTEREDRQFSPGNENGRFAFIAERLQSRQRAPLDSLPGAVNDKDRWMANAETR